MSNTIGKPGSLRGLLYIALLCGVIGLVPAFAVGVKHASAAMLGFVGLARSAPHSTYLSDAREHRLLSGPTGMRPMSGCIAYGVRERLCRV